MKKLFSIIVLMAVAAMSVAWAAGPLKAAGPYRHLDVNFDNHIDVGDVNLLLDAILNGHSDPAEGEEPVGEDPLLAGGDISLLPSYAATSVQYLDYDGQLINSGNTLTDVIGFLTAEGWNAARVRLFVDPSQASSDDVGQGVRQDLEYVTNLGKAIKAAGMKFVLDFHYSDSWADPVKQFTPAAWVGQTDEQLAVTIYNYTKSCLNTLIEAGATPDYIQTGNEISYGILWGKQGSTYVKADNEAGWERFRTLEAQAIKACREVCPKAKIIIHTELVRNINLLRNYYNNVNSLDYDIIGLSYYPYYHGLLPQLESALSAMETAHPDKDIMIMETGYFHIWQADDVKYDYSATYPISAAGQKAFTEALVALLKEHQNVKGLFWWFPEANDGGLWPNQVRTDWYNAGLWDNQTHYAMPAIKSVGDFAK